MTAEDILNMVDEGVLDATDAATAGLQYLSKDDIDDLLRVNGWDDDDFPSDEFYELVEEGTMDPNEVLNAVLQYLSTDDVADLARINGWDEDEDYEDDDDSNLDEMIAEDKIPGVGFYEVYLTKDYSKYVAYLYSTNGEVKIVDLDIDLGMLEVDNAAEYELRKAFDKDFEDD